ncbi:MAG: sulfotransferase domain-containing protein [Parabacteroides gordonii]|uniref:sulfotransferase domain-containing protein n=1 Tax=Parabacteroides gordonii TaxID=574930 RepID=UPI003A859975
MNMTYLFHAGKNILAKKVSFLYLLLTGKAKKIDFFIIGAQKSGTTTLFAYLYKHPDCIGTTGKESLLFTKANYKDPTATKIQASFAGKKLFKSNRKLLFFEATPANVYLKECPERLWRHNPKARLIFLVREPISRAFSEYNMHCLLAQKKITIREDPDQEYLDCLKNPDKYPFSWFIEEEFRKIKETGSYLSSAFHYPDYIRRGLYSDQLERYYHYFSPEQILILEATELKKQKKETLYRIEDFLNISHFSWKEDELVNSNIGVYTQQIPVECKQALTLFFKSWNNKFFDMIGHRMDW